MFRAIFNGRLAEFKETPANAKMWDDHWKQKITPRSYYKAMSGDLGDFDKPWAFMSQYLSPSDKILEAGCGLGRCTMALRKRGYACEGVDYAAHTVEEVKKLNPDLPIYVGDCFALEVPDGYYAAYLSFGVIEHFIDGPEPILLEARRILRKAGLAYFSVPYLNLLRRKRLNQNLNVADPEKFYQYFFNYSELSSTLNEFGFQIVYQHGYGAWKGIKDEIALFQFLYNIPKIGGIYRILTHIIP